ncbi:hypothetical protein RJ492_002718 [Pluralibacter gergoviae]|uniref:Uncharacterized protein n=1 Tax=Pluralibacter gergoviae TaxID=61647 RepID=A0AAI9DL31_PLUGE|nr:hypothetical protein [Pluralibacter gergoviae]EKV0915414.1 hypothetical protein [Pluralibacter gergoviae]EKV9908477.1 hypothetical protein [Pluralibacter gergoviae]EKW7273531.1 hypothetical protein [Pluralibacter gergoviae]ELD4294916.1 hypothetical protein [Pluralibacter gergoviae]ELD4307703.1 hypothetical protein [Pluralibacter gergoviae]
MGWSLPEVPEREAAPSWSPWFCLLIIILGLFAGLLVAVLTSPATGLPSLSSGHWLPLTAWTFAGISAAIAIYSFCQEMLAIRVWNWNAWCRNMRLRWRLRWRLRAHQHLAILGHVFAAADVGLLSRLAHTQEGDSADTPPLTLLPGEPLTPGISRFEQLLRHLIAQITPSIRRRYPSGPLQIIVQTNGRDKGRESHAFHRVWTAGSLPWKAEVHLQEAGPSFGDWERFLGAARNPVLVLAMHYRQPDDLLPEFTSALFLMPQPMLNPDEQKNALRLFRAMPLDIRTLAAELGELRDMALTPASKKHLVWHSGLSDAPRQSVGRVLNDLSVPLYDSMGTGGVIDYDTACARYGGLAGWAMAGAAADMAARGPACQWLLLEGEGDAWAVALGNVPPALGHDGFVVPPPFPAGSVLMALLLNAGLYGLMIRSFPSAAFSWPGIVLLLLSLIVTLPGLPILLRRAVAYFQRPEFIRAARWSGKE